MVAEYGAMPQIFNNLLALLYIQRYIIHMKTLKELNDRINELQQIIDTEQMDADAGCHWSQSRIINAELEKEEICDAIDAIAIANCLV